MYADDRAKELLGRRLKTILAMCGAAVVAIAAVVAAVSGEKPLRLKKEVIKIVKQ